MYEYHKPVLLKESVDALISSPDGIYADATFGGGGHSSEILSRLSDKGRLIAFDRDADAVERAFDDPRFCLIHNNFRFIHNFTLFDRWKEDGKDLENSGEKWREDGTDTENGEERWREDGTGSEGQKVEKLGGKGSEPKGVSELKGEDWNEMGLDGVLADLGVSSHQFDTAERGFSFRYDAPLDMRMNTQAELTAADVVNNYDAEDLERIFRIYGEVDNSRKLTQLIIKQRAICPIETTGQLDKAIEEATPKFAEHKYLAKVYQALRIEVNQEMRSLEKFLEGAAKSLKSGGRLVVITYHSLEDRMVKNFIKSGRVDGVLEKDLFGKSREPFEAVNRKPILPSEEEIAGNTRARSAKLRIAVKK